MTEVPKEHFNPLDNGMLREAASGDSQPDVILSQNTFLLILLLVPGH